MRLGAEAARGGGPGGELATGAIEGSGRDVGEPGPGGGFCGRGRRPARERWCRGS